MESSQKGREGTTSKGKNYLKTVGDGNKDYIGREKGDLTHVFHSPSRTVTLTNVLKNRFIKYILKKEIIKKTTLFEELADDGKKLQFAVSVS